MNFRPSRLLLLVGLATLCLQGGSPEGYSQVQPWHNSAFTAAVGEHASWGYFDFRMTDEPPYRDGFQSIPADWSIRAPRKAAFFRLLAEITGAQ